MGPVRDEGELASDGGPALRLAEVLRRAPLLMDALGVARAVAAPQWLVAIRDVVWDDLHGRPLTVLLHDDDLLVVAPFGLADLFGCVCRHNPARVPPERYERRVAEKRFRERWPRMRYVPPAAPPGAGRSP
jgi:hypothetical protein